LLGLSWQDKELWEEGSQVNLSTLDHISTGLGIAGIYVGGAAIISALLTLMVSPFMSIDWYNVAVIVGFLSVVSIVLATGSYLMFYYVYQSKGL